jgi:uncharacterized protein YjbI with pentapeptide repeats
MFIASTVLKFLREAQLINRKKHRRLFRDSVFYPRVVGLKGANLSGAFLDKVSLISTSEKELVSLEGAILRKASITEADLCRADLRDVDFRKADL